MSEYTLEIKQIVDYPRCRIYRQFVQALIADRSIRVSGGSGLFYFVVLCAYANFRTSYKRIDGISYTIYPGEWIMSVEELSRYFRTRFRLQTLAALEGLQKKGLISFLVLGHGKLVKFKIRGCGVTTRFSTTMRPVRRIPAFSSSLYPLPQNWSVPVTARRWTPYWIYG